jgi:hypothetical protein
MRINYLIQILCFIVIITDLFYLFQMKMTYKCWTLLKIKLYLNEIKIMLTQNYSNLVKMGNLLYLYKI